MANMDELVCRRVDSDYCCGCFIRESERWRKKNLGENKTNTHISLRNNLEARQNHRAPSFKRERERAGNTAVVYAEDVLSL